MPGAAGACIGDCPPDEPSPRRRHAALPVSRAGRRDRGPAPPPWSGRWRRRCGRGSGRPHHTGAPKADPGLGPARARVRPAPPDGTAWAHAARPAPHNERVRLPSGNASSGDLQMSVLRTANLRGTVLPGGRSLSPLLRAPSPVRPPLATARPKRHGKNEEPRSQHAI